ncbi:MAG TPA: hypothetical protein VKM36_00360, partial [Balneolaceae bacterium]|nr:hypothetical protein [Balneolaceae bacterium]
TLLPTKPSYRKELELYDLHVYTLKSFFGNSLLIVYEIDHQASSPSPIPFCIRQFFKIFLDSSEMRHNKL